MRQSPEYVSGRGRVELAQRVALWMGRGIVPVLYGTSNLELEGDVRPRTPRRPAGDAATGILQARMRAVYGAPADNPDAAILPFTRPFTVGRDEKYDQAGRPYTVCEMNEGVAEELITLNPIGGVYLVHPRSFRQSPYNRLDVVSLDEAPLLERQPTLVTYRDLSFDLRSLPMVSMIVAPVSDNT